MNIISIRWMAFWHTFTYNSFRRKKNNVLDDFNFWIFFFSWKYNPIFLFSIATRPGEQWYRYCVDTWLQEFIGFFFYFGADDFVFFLCLQQLFVYIFFPVKSIISRKNFSSFKNSLYVTDCVLCPSYGIHTWFYIIARANIFFTEFFLFIYFGTIFLFVCF